MTESELYELLDAYLAGELDEAGRTWLQIELAAADPEVLKALADQVAVDQALRVHLGTDGSEPDRRVVDSVIAHLSLGPAEDFRARLLARISGGHAGRVRSTVRIPVLPEAGREVRVPFRPWHVGALVAAACVAILFTAQLFSRRVVVRPWETASVAGAPAGRGAPDIADEEDPAQIENRLRTAERLRREYVRRWLFGSAAARETRPEAAAAPVAREAVPAPAAPEPKEVPPAAPRVPEPAPPAAAEVPEAPSSPAPPPPSGGRESVVVEARFERVQGTVYALSDEGRIVASSGQILLSGHGVQTGAGDSRAVIRYHDGTRLDIGMGSTVSLLDYRRGEERTGPSAGGKGVFVVEGELTAEVVRQPARQPMILATPQAEVRVLGTRLLLSVTSAATQVEVREGRVQLVRRADGTAADVAAGQFAVAAEGVALAAKPVLSAEGLRLWLKLDEACGIMAIDSSGNGNHGILKGGPKWGEGRFGAGLLLDVHDSIRVRGTPSLKPAAQAAVSVWVRPGPIDSGGSDVVSMGDSYALRVLRDGNVWFFVYNGSEWIGASSKAARLTDGAWHHVIGQKTASGLEVYVDGVLKGATPMISPIVYSLGSNLFVGKHGDRKTEFYFGGSVDDVRIYSRALSEKEIKALAEQGN